MNDIFQTYSMEEADALATCAAIISKRILTIGTPAFLYKKYGDIYHVHIVLLSAPTSSAEEMKNAEQWAEHTFSSVRFDAFGSHHRQIRFSVPDRRVQNAVRDSGDDIQPAVGGMVGRGLNRRGIGELLSSLESSKEKMGLKFYSVSATTLDQVFLNVITQNDVLEEWYAAVHPSKKPSWRLW
jgi:hypothetical protein